MDRLPRDAEAYRRTPIFDETSVPAGLLRRHTTKAAVWGRICVLEGELMYRVLEPEIREERLAPGRDGIVAPQVPHEVEPVGRVRFFVEFLRRPSHAEGADPAELADQVDQVDQVDPAD